MIREIQLSEISHVEHLIDEFIERISQDEEQVSRLKKTLLENIETRSTVLLAGFTDDNTPFGFGILKPSTNSIAAFHPLDDTWKELFTQVFHHVKMSHSVIRIPGNAVPESMYDLITEVGFTRTDSAHMSIKRGDIESLGLGDLPDNILIARYSEDMKKPVAEMMFESYLGASWAHQYPDQVGTVDACQQTLGKMNETSRLSILTADAIPIGSCQISVHGARGHVGLVGIRPEYRRRGLGRIIVTHALLDAVKENRKIESIHLDVTHGDPAFNLYESIGFITNSITPMFAWSTKE
jgi:ribosomal protein S18 acetylase RimI-like enzyme